MFGQLSDLESLRGLIRATPLRKKFNKTYFNDIKEQFALIIPILFD